MSQLDFHHTFIRRSISSTHYPSSLQILSIILIILSLHSSSSLSATTTQCNTLKRPTILTDPYRLITTPSFPLKFETPYCAEWIIDENAAIGQSSLIPLTPAYLAAAASYHRPLSSAISSRSSSSSSSSSAGTGTERFKIIYLYLNQMYLKTNVTISAFHYSPFDYGFNIEDDEDDDDDDLLLLDEDDHNEEEGGHYERTEHPDVHTEYLGDYDYHHHSNEPPPYLVDDSTKMSLGPWDCAKAYRRARALARRRNETFGYGIEMPLYSVTLSEDLLYQSNKLGLIYTTCKYMSIKVEIWSPYTSHIRVRDHLLDVYGFNISYEISENDRKSLMEATGKDFCSAYLCNFNGHCRVSSDFQDFFCECHSGRVGRNCEYDFYKCNPAKNLTFCYNGGTCRMFGNGHGMCFCPENFSGSQCEVNLRDTVKVCPGRRQCEKNCKLANSRLATSNRTTRMIQDLYGNRSAGSSGPVDRNISNGVVNEGAGADEISEPESCTCESPPNLPKDWILYEGTLQASPTNLQKLPNWEFPTSSNRIRKSYTTRLSEEELQLKRRIEAELMKKLERLYIGFPKLDKVVVTSFSTQSRFSFHFFGPSSMINETIACLSDIQDSPQLFPNFSLAANFTPHVSTYPQVYITDLKLNSQYTPLRLNADFTISCMTFGSKFVAFKWFKNGVLINDTLALRHISKSRSTYPLKSSVRSTSVLIVDHSSTADRGTFTCQVSDFGGQEQCKDLNVVVTTQPIIEIVPRSLTLVRNDTGKTILCAATVESPNNYSYSWYKNGTKVTNNDAAEGSNVLEITERVHPYGLLLRIIKANESAIYTCKIQNLVGESSDEMYVEVLPSTNAPSCRHEVEKIDNFTLEWNLTGVEKTAKIRCPHDYKGFVQRRCMQNLETMKPKWGNDDFSRCLSEELDRINGTLRRFQSGFGMIDEFDDLLLRLNQHINGKGSLYSGEGEKIISVLNGIGQYALKKAVYIKDSNFQTLFFQTASSLLRFPGSCVYETSVITLSNLIHQISTEFHNTSSRNVNPFINEVVVVEHVELEAENSVIFPNYNHTYPKWLNVQLSIEGAQQQLGSFFVTVLKNITLLLAKNTLTDDHYPSYLHHSKLQRDIHSKSQAIVSLVSIAPVEIGSPIIYFSSTNYVPLSSTYFILAFNISPEVSYQIRKKAIIVSCGSLDDNAESGISFHHDNHHCVLLDISQDVVRCKCDRFGQYALGVHRLQVEDEPSQELFHWSILFGSILCVICCIFSLGSILAHLQCSLGANNIYILKLITCLSIIASICFAFRLNTTSLSTMLTTCLCTFLILSLCCQLTKTTNVLFSTVPDLSSCLRSISSLYLALILSFTCTLPIWISATVYAHGKTIIRDVDGNILNNEPLKNKSPIFATFIAIMAIVFLGILTVYYKASFILRKTRMQVEAAKLNIVDYRLKTLNRALVISFGILMHVSGIVLYDWSPESATYQYYYGFTSTFLGFITFFSYTIHSEYPIPGWLVSFLLCSPQSQNGTDFEKGYLDMSSSRSLNHNGLNNNNVTNTRTPQQKIFEDDLLRCNNTEDHEELDEFEVSAVRPRYRKNTYSSQASSDPETLETFTGTGGSSLLSNNNLSLQLMQQHQQSQPCQGAQHVQPIGRNYGNGTNVKRTCSANSVKRSSIVSSNKIPRTMTNPGPSSSSSANSQPFGNGSLCLGMSGRFQNSSNNSIMQPSNSNACSSGCAKHGNCDGSIGYNGRQRSNSNSMSSLFRFSNGIGTNTERRKPEREKCRLFGIDDMSSYVLPSAKSSSFRNGQPGTSGGPLSCLNPSRVPRRVGEDYQAYVPPNPHPSLSSSAGSCGTGTLVPSAIAMAPNFVSAGNGTNNGANSAYEQPQLQQAFQSTPRNGFNRELPLLPPPNCTYASLRRQSGQSQQLPPQQEGDSSHSSNSDSYIYEEPDLEGITTPMKNTHNLSPNSQETDKGYSTSHIVSPSSSSATHTQTVDKAAPSKAEMNTQGLNGIVKPMPMCNGSGYTSACVNTASSHYTPMTYGPLPTLAASALVPSVPH